MNKATRRLMGVCLGVAGAALPLLAAGTAQAAEDDGDTANDTQDSTQALTSVLATAGNGQFVLTDALNGDNRPDGANGVETEFPPLDYRYAEAPLGDLLADGPLE